MEMKERTLDFLRWKPKFMRFIQLLEAETRGAVEMNIAGWPYPGVLLALALMKQVEQFGARLCKLG